MSAKVLLSLVEVLLSLVEVLLSLVEVLLSLYINVGQQTQTKICERTLALQLIMINISFTKFHSDVFLSLPLLCLRRSLLNIHQTDLGHCFVAVVEPLSRSLSSCWNPKMILLPFDGLLRRLIFWFFKQKI